MPADIHDILKRQATNNGRSITAHAQILLHGAIMQAESGASMNLEATAAIVTNKLMELSKELSQAVNQKHAVNALRLPLEDYPS